MRRKLIKFGAGTIKSIGINILRDEPDDSSTIWRFIIIFGLFALADLSAGIVSITNTDDFYSFATPIPYVAGVTITLSGFYLVYRHKSTVSELFYQMDENFYIYPDEDFIRVEYPWYLEEKKVTMIMKVAKYVSFAALSVICLPTLGEAIYFGRVRTVVYPMWTPWLLDHLSAQLGAFLLQSLQGFCVVWINYTIMVFLLIIVIEFQKQYRRLTGAVLSLEHRSRLVGGDFDLVLKGNIVHCIRHHQVMYKNFRLFEIWFSVFFSIELAISGVTFAFALYVAINATSLSQILNYFSIVFILCVDLLVRCLISEVFSHLNDSLSYTLIWDAPWDKVNKENGKLLVMFHLMTCRPLRLFGLSIFEATRVTFGKLVRITYSFLNVLNLSLKK